MRRFLVRLLVNAVALWLTTFIVAGVRVVSFDESDGFATVVSYLLVALVFGLVNGILGNAIRIVAFPLYLLTLGLLSFIVNGLLLIVVAWFTSFAGFGLVVDGFWWGVLGAFVLGLIGGALNLILRPLTRERNG